MIAVATEMAGKRKSNVGLTEGNSYNHPSGRAPKAIRTALSLSSGQRLGESANFIPLSQAAGADEDDEGALDLVQGSQEMDESSLTSSILYGMHHFHALLY